MENLQGLGIEQLEIAMGERMKAKKIQETRIYYLIFYGDAKL